MHAKLLAAGAAVLLAACDAPGGDTTGDAGGSTQTVAGIAEATAPSRGPDAGPPPDATAGAEAVPISDATHAYVSNVSNHNLFMIAAGELALERSRSPAVQDFARDQIARHKIRQSGLQTAVIGTEPELSPPTAMDTSRRAMLANLRNAEDFDRLYRDQQGALLNEALSLHKAYASNGEHPPLRDLASEATTADTGTLDRLQALAEAVAKEPG